MTVSFTTPLLLLLSLLQNMAISHANTSTITTSLTITVTISIASRVTYIIHTLLSDFILEWIRYTERLKLVENLTD